MNEFQKERKEHPTLPEKDIKQIVRDHMKEENESPLTYAYRLLKRK